MRTIKILQFSDLHIGRNDLITNAAKSLVDRILIAFGDEDIKPILIFTGDTVDDGKEEQFQKAAELFLPLRSQGFSLHFLPGNHDYGWNGNVANPKSFQWFCQYLLESSKTKFPNVIDIGKHFLVMLDSMEAENGWYDHLLADGELGPKQRHELESVLLRLNAFRSQRGSKVIVALHHHPFDFPDMHLFEQIGNYIAHRLKDGDALLPLLKDHCDILLFGHEHRHVHFGRQLKEHHVPATVGVPLILACGSSTGIEDPKPLPDSTGGRHAWLIEIDEESGEVSVENWA